MKIIFRVSFCMKFKITLHEQIVKPAIWIQFTETVRKYFVNMVFITYLRNCHIQNFQRWRCVKSRKSSDDKSIKKAKIIILPEKCK